MITSVSSFMGWFLEQFYRIGQSMIGKLDTIEIAPNVTLMSFIITIAIINVLISILITSPNLGQKIEREIKKEKRSKK